MDARAQVLIVDDEANVRKVLSAMLQQAGYATLRAASAEEALLLVRSQDPELVLTDLGMPGMSGMELLSELSREFPEIPVVMLTAHGSVENAVEAMKKGARDFLTKPFDKQHVRAVIDSALAQAVRARLEFHGPLARGTTCGIIGDSPVMRELFTLIDKVASKPTRVLVTGETGTGKELVARALHAGSPRAAASLVSVNCGALPEKLVESELFGHERGAFSGADCARPGRFELADGGTLFLDEVGELPLEAQVKMLRVLQDGMVDRVGSSESRKVDVRLVAATHRDLKKEVAAGRFREDLLYRLNVVELRVPSLRERLEDLPALVDFFLDKHAERLECERRCPTAEALAMLQAQDWPGNVRQLENSVERALLLADGPDLQAADFGVTEGAAASTVILSSSEFAEGTDLKEASRAAAAGVERRMIRAALAATEGNVTHAAERLGLSRRGLQVKCKELGLRGTERGGD